MATGIIAVEVIYTIPLLVLIHLNGDTEIVINEDNPPFTNVIKPTDDTIDNKNVTYG